MVWHFAVQRGWGAALRELFCICTLSVSAIILLFTSVR